MISIMWVEGIDPLQKRRPAEEAMQMQIANTVCMGVAKWGQPSLSRCRDLPKNCARFATLHHPGSARHVTSSFTAHGSGGE